MKKLLLALVTAAVTLTPFAAYGAAPWNIVAKYALAGEQHLMFFAVNGARAAYASEDECRAVLSNPVFLNKLADLQVQILVETSDIEAAKSLTASCIREGDA